ncbi:MAG TPA: SpoIID/LytB domain-containing protein [Gemmatimonadaceae bacterium]|nr:SpoIID/LytB domain-containing protein [Gemmatimonadaceae bacterium]
MRRAVRRGALLVALLTACGQPNPPPEAPPPRPVPAPSGPAAAADTSAPPAMPDTSPPTHLEDIINTPAPSERSVSGTHVVRVALVSGVSRVTLSASGPWRIFDSDGASTLVRASGGESWVVDRVNGRLRATPLSGAPAAARPAPFVVRPAARNAFLSVNGKRYRGEITIESAPGGVTVINRVYIEDYLRGVVPLELGQRTSDERAAVEAQAVAARSYVYTHLATEPGRAYDVLATVLDQVYGGADVEQPLSDDAVRRTTGQVLTYGGRIVNAPYFSTCGGSTAAASEVWRERDEPYLVSVSDRIPGTADRYYCDQSPRFRWTQTFDRAALSATLEKYLRSYASVAGRIGRVRDVTIQGRTTSGRVETLRLATDQGSYSLRGNDIRFVLRTPGGEILASTYFSIDRESDDAGLARLILRGSGYGHGVGMCQWGAIGRARAGQDYRAILRVYYPGTTLAVVAE